MASALFVALAAVLYGVFFKNSFKIDTTIKTGTAMDTAIRQTIYAGDPDEAEKAAQSISESISMLESTFSCTVRDSQISKINRHAGIFVPAGQNVLYSLQALNKISEDSGGAVDVTAGALYRVWNTTKNRSEMPAESDIQKALSHVDYRAVKILDGQVRIAKGQELNMDAASRGIACDSAKAVLKKYAVKGAVIAVGGNILLYGENPASSAWHVQIKNPNSTDSDPIGVLSVGECCVCGSSGQSEEAFGGIIDPNTGYPPENGITSVTVICDSGLTGSALSYACLILGYEDSLALLKKYNAQAVFIDKDRKVRVTDGIKANFKITDRDYTFTLG